MPANSKSGSGAQGKAGPKLPGVGKPAKGKASAALFKKHIQLSKVSPISNTGRNRRQAAMLSEVRTLAMASRTASHSMSPRARSTNPVSSSPTLQPQPTDKSYKQGAYRLAWKGFRDPNTGYTSGNHPFVDTRDSKSWTPQHDNARNQLGTWLQHNVQGIFNPFGKSHLAENSHLHAGSFLGTNDVLSAPPASIHQNTEWLAIESGIKHLKRKADSGTLGGDLRIKSTGYVFDSGPFQGMMKAARYKIYVGPNKVFDHVTMGRRGNIDKKETTQLESKVKGLGSHSKPFSLHGTAPKPLFGQPPTEIQARQGQRSGASSSHPQFTDLTPPKGKRLSGQDAMNYATVKYAKYTK